MGWVEIDEATDDRLRALGRAWGVAKGEALSRVLAEWDESTEPSRIEAGTSTPSAGASASTWDEGRAETGGRVAVYFDYRDVRNCALFDPVTGHLQVTAGPASGSSFTSPSTAASKIVAMLNPSITASRNGWITWKLVETDELLDTLRSSGRS